MKYAVVFPGQGSQSIDMLQDLAAEYDVVENTFSEASAALGYDLLQLVRDNPDDKLNQTEYTQPAMLAAGVAVWRIWESLDNALPSVLAGHSLGEYTALVAAKSLGFTDAAKLVAIRGKLMQEAVPHGEGAMAAILGLADEQVITVCGDAAEDEVVEAVNFNSPNQVVIAGNIAAVQRAIDLAEQAGAKRAILLPVSVPSHSSLMLAAAETYATYLQQATISTAAVPVIQNFDACIHTDVAAIMNAMQRQLHSPVRWVDSVQSMLDQGVTTILELGPGKVLAGLCKRINRKVNVIAVDTPTQLERAIAALGE